MFMSKHDLRGKREKKAQLYERGCVVNKTKGEEPKSLHYVVLNSIELWSSGKYM